MPPVIGWPTGDTHQFGLPRYVAPNSSVALRGSPVTTRALRRLSGRAGLANHSHQNLTNKKEEMSCASEIFMRTPPFTHTPARTISFLLHDGASRMLILMPFRILIVLRRFALVSSKRVWGYDSVMFSRRVDCPPLVGEFVVSWL
jgi:hypothetical protein